MATTVRATREKDECVVLHEVTWEMYEALLETSESRQGSVLMSYNLGRLMIMSPSPKHEIGTERLGLIVRLTAAGVGMTCLGVGRATLKREDLQRGKEADTAFYLANEPKVRAREELDFDLDPPPDLAVEVETTHQDDAMWEIYAALGVPEVWHYNGETLSSLWLQSDGTYELQPTSRSLPFLQLEEIPRWLEHAATAGESAMIVEYLDWVRNTLAPFHRHP